MIALLDDTTVERVAWSLLHSLWQVTSIAAVLAAILRVVPRRDGQLRYWITSGALTLAVAVPIGTFIQSKKQSATNPLADLAVIEDSRSAFSTDLEAWAALPVALPTDFDLPPAPDAPLTTHRQPWLRWVAELWILGVTVLAVRLGIALRRVRGLYSHGLRPLPEFHRELVEHLTRQMRVWVPVRAFTSVGTQVPIVIGWFRPRILLPMSTLLGLTPSHLEAILVHEIAHIRRFDYLVNLLQTVVETLFFFNPAVWWISTTLRIEREHCCDDTAAEACGSIVYAHALASLELLRQAPPQPAIAATGGSLVERIRRVLTAPPQPRSFRPGAGWFSVIVITTLMVGLGFRVEADDPLAKMDSNPLAPIEWSVEPAHVADSGELSEPSSSADPSPPGPACTDPTVTSADDRNPNAKDPSPGSTRLSPTRGKVLSTVMNGRFVVITGHDGVTLGGRYVIFLADQGIAFGTVISGADDIAVLSIDEPAAAPVRAGDAVAELPGRFPMDGSRWSPNRVVFDVAETPSKRRLYGLGVMPGRGILPKSGPDRAVEWTHSIQKTPSSDKPPKRGFSVVGLEPDLDLVVVSGGSDDGLRVGETLTVHRGSKSIASLEIIRTTDDLAGARIVHVQPDGIQIGDAIASRPAPQVRKGGTLATVNAVGPTGRLVGLQATDGEFGKGQRFWIRRGELLLGLIEVIETDPATARVRLISPDHTIQIGDQALSEESLNPLDTQRRTSSSTGSIRYRVRPGDSLRSIAHSQLGDQRRWEEILRMNPGFDSERLEVGRELRLPSPSDR